MYFSAQYGYAYYGNAQYGRFAQQQLTYGAWPYEAEPGMFTTSTPEPEVKTLVPVPDPAVNVAIIKRLRTELAFEQDIAKRALLREKIERARMDKVKAFQLAARIQDEEETLFMLLH